MEMQRMESGVDVVPKGPRRKGSFRGNKEKVLVV